MATVDELLNKQKSRLQKMTDHKSTPTPITNRKKIQRTGPTRPWQENLPQYKEMSPIFPTFQNDIALAESSQQPDSVSNASPKPLADPLAMREHSVSNALAEIAFEALIGKEKKLLQFIFKKCQTTGSLETPILTTEEILQNLEIGSERLRNLIYRLGKKNFLAVISVKNGRSGWRKFRLSQKVFQQITFNESVSNA